MTVIAAFAAGCGNAETKATVDAGAIPGGLTPEQAARVVAKVGDRTITLGDYAAAIDRMDQFDRLRYQSPERKRELLKELVDVELLAIEAKRRGLDKKEATEAALRQIMRDALLADVQKSLPTPADLPDDEVKSYYEAHREEYREPERRRVSAIVVESDKTAAEVLAEAKKGKTPTDWGKLFFSKSMTAPKEKVSNVPLDLAGDLGIVGPPDDAKGSNPRVPDAVRKAVFKLSKVSDIAEEVVTDGKYFYVVRMSGLTPGHERSLAEADRSIRVMLLQKRLQELESKLEQDLRTKYKVEIDDAALSKLKMPDLPPTSAVEPSVKAPPMPIVPKLEKPDGDHH